MNQLNNLEIIKKAMAHGAAVYASISGGKDGQAMVAVLINEGFNITGLIHADLGKIEWANSLGMCQTLSTSVNVPLHIVTRTDGTDMVGRWADRMHKLEGTGKPFWSSSSARYCTSDMKRDPINKFLRNCGQDFIISCEGIRGAESTARAAKNPLTIREKISSSFYDGMTVEQAIANFTPGKRLALTYFPIFEFTTEEVWNTFGMTGQMLETARAEYKTTKVVPAWWAFHNAYVFGNERVSCMFCVLGSINDLGIAAHHNPELLQELISMEERSGATFKNGWSLKNLAA